MAGVTKTVQCMTVALWAKSTTPTKSLEGIRSEFERLRLNTTDDDAQAERGRLKLDLFSCTWIATT